MSLRIRKYIGTQPFFRAAAGNGQERPRSRVPQAIPMAHCATGRPSGLRWLSCPDHDTGPGRLSADTRGMPVRLHHIVIDTYDLPRLARFWTQALGWRILSEREREIVIGTEDRAPVGMCFMPVSDPKTVKNRVHLDLTTSAGDRDQEIERRADAHQVARLGFR